MSNIRRSVARRPARRTVPILRGGERRVQLVAAHRRARRGSRAGLVRPDGRAAARGRHRRGRAAARGGLAVGGAGRRGPRRQPEAAERLLALHRTYLEAPPPDDPDRTAAASEAASELAGDDRVGARARSRRRRSVTRRRSCRPGTSLTAGVSPTQNARSSAKNIRPTSWRWPSTSTQQRYSWPAGGGRGRRRRPPARSSTARTAACRLSSAPSAALSDDAAAASGSAVISRVAPVDGSRPSIAVGLGGQPLGRPATHEQRRGRDRQDDRRGEGRDPAAAIRRAARRAGGRGRRDRAPARSLRRAGAVDGRPDRPCRAAAPCART